jgi:hypothetical protein
MNKQIPWVRVLVEGAAIIASILLAFGIDAAWDARQDRERELRQLIALHRDFQENFRQLDSLIHRQNVPVQAHTEALRVMHGLVPTPSADSASTLLSRSLGYYRLIPVTGAYESLISSGDIGLIRSSELRSALASWAGRVRDGYEDEDLSARVRVELLRAMSQHVSVPTLFEPEQLEFLGVETLAAPSSLESLLRDPRVSSLLLLLAFAERNYLQDYLERTRSGAEEIIGLIETELVP